ncbi:MAG: hypothetical protein GF346_07790 [Candidatus Eisenbacteria bacterium]|nr:hypothetical protein [Candidatus Latescibacterota bacterium]MBD3302334.1 hypothetical protein [Candidatus Eisenbacteria bacterium]
MGRNRAFRILMYSHDTYGLGHLTRTLRIARAVRRRWEHVSILILSGSPIAPYMPLPENTDLVKLPSVVKAGQDWYKPRDLRVTFRRIKKIRRELIRSAAECFRPDVFMVDNVPLGMKAEILPTLRHLHARGQRTRIVLNLRDILDDPQVIRDAWARDGVPELLETVYDRVFVLGDPRFFDAREAYGLPRDKARQLGYACPGLDRHPSPEPPVGGPPRVLVTAGGGGDGAELLLRAIEGLGPLTHTNGRGAPDLRVEIVTGPLMDPRLRTRIVDRSIPTGIEVFEFVPDLPDRMARSHLVVTMGGYNTCCELLSHARRGLILPRVAPRVEQFLRAEAFESHDLSRTLPLEAGPNRIRAAVLEMLDSGPAIHDGELPRRDGLVNLTEELAHLCPELEGCSRPNPLGDPAPSPGTADRPAISFWPGTRAPLSRPLQ